MQIDTKYNSSWMKEENVCKHLLSKLIQLKIRTLINLSTEIKNPQSVKQNKTKKLNDFNIGPVQTFCYCRVELSWINQAPIVQRVDNFIQWMNHYPANKMYSD